MSADTIAGVVLMEDQAVKEAEASNTSANV
jgi:hypothetical protein